MKTEDRKEDAKLTSKEKSLLFMVSSLAAGIGAIVGMIAYYQQWLG